MDPTGLIPSPDTIPVHWGWFKFLLLFTFLLHLILMNLMLGGGLLAFFRRLRGGETPPEAQSLPVLIALTVNLGIPPLLFVQVLYGQFLYSSSVLMAVAWISVIPLLILAYYAAYGFVHRESRWGTLWLGLSTLIMLVIGFFLSNNMTLMLRPERWAVYFDRPGGSFLNWTEPTLLPRYLHFLLASLAVASLGRAVFHRIRSGPAAEEIRPALRHFAGFSLAQMAMGVLYWITLPGEIGGLFLGGSAMHTAHLWTGIALALVALAAAWRGRLWTSVGLLAGTMLLMVAVRDLVRTAYLEPVFSPGELILRQQLSPFLLFLASFVLVGAVIFWMLRQAWRARA